MMLQLGSLISWLRPPKPFICLYLGLRHFQWSPRLYIRIVTSWSTATFTLHVKQWEDWQSAPTCSPGAFVWHSIYLSDKVAKGNQRLKETKIFFKTYFSKYFLKMSDKNLLHLVIVTSELEAKMMLQFLKQKLFLITFCCCCCCNFCSFDHPDLF